MKRIGLTTWIACAALGGLAADEAPAAAPAQSKAAPRIEFATPVYDFGKIDAGQIVRHDFVFTNTGNAMLEITQVRPGCGCTTAGTWDKEVAPGKTGSIPIQFNAGSFSGSVTKGITVTSNDPERTNVFLQFKGNIWTPISVTPPSVYFSLTDEAPTNVTKVVRIVSNLDEELTVSPPELADSPFKAELKTIKPGKEYALEITADSAAVSRTVSTPIELKTSHAKTPTLKVMASAMVQPAVSVVPTRVVIPASGSSSTAASPSVTIRNTSATPLVLSDASINLDGAQVEVSEVQPGKLFRLALKLPSDVKIPAGQAIEASVKSNHPKFPVIKVPVIQLARPANAPTRQITPVVRPAATAQPTPPLIAPPTPVTK